MSNTEDSQGVFLKKKKCTGPLHGEGGEFLSIEEFYFHKSGLRKGLPVSRCRRCINYNKMTEKGKDLARRRWGGLVSSQRYRWVFEEIIRRVGVEEGARLMSCSTSTLRAVRLMPHHAGRPPQKSIQRYTAVRAVKVLKELRQADVVRHRKSIAHGSKIRGRVEKIPSHRNDFYSTVGDVDLERKKKGRSTKSASV